MDRRKVLISALGMPGFACVPLFVRAEPKAASVKLILDAGASIEVPADWRFPSRDGWRTFDSPAAAAPVKVSATTMPGGSETLLVRAHPPDTDGVGMSVIADATRAESAEAVRATTADQLRVRGEFFAAALQNSAIQSGGELVEVSPMVAKIVSGFPAYLFTYVRVDSRLRRLKVRRAFVTVPLPTIGITLAMWHPLRDTAQWAPIEERVLESLRISP